MGNKLTHINEQGDAHMVDVGDKQITVRIAIAQGKVKMQRETMEMILSGSAKKGDVIATARIAGIMAAKKTSDLIPLCHPLGLSNVTLEIEPEPSLPGFTLRATTKVEAKTGVEMEALTACSVACLTIYDMAKAVDRGMEIVGVKLIEKSGGKSGHWKIGDGMPADGT